MLKFANKCLEDYPANLARLEVLTGDFRHNPSDKLEEEIKSLRFKTVPLQKMIGDLSEEKAVNVAAQDMLTVLEPVQYLFTSKRINAIVTIWYVLWSLRSEPVQYLFTIVKPIKYL